MNTVKHRRVILIGVAVTILFVCLALIAGMPSRATAAPLASIDFWPTSMTCYGPQLGTCNTTGAIDTDPSTYGTFTKVFGGGSSSMAGARLYFDTPVTNPTVSWKFTATSGTWYFATAHKVGGGGQEFLHGADHLSTEGSASLTGTFDYIYIETGGANDTKTINIWYVFFTCDTCTPTPTPTFTPTPGNTSTYTPTFTATNVYTSTAVVVSRTENLLRDGSFDTNPDVAAIGFSPWNNSFWDVSQSNFQPADQYMPYLNSVVALCGDNFYQLDPQPGVLPPVEVEEAGTYVEQSFDWIDNRNMYISLAAKTSDPDTFGVVSLVTPDNSVQVLEPNLTNMTGAWEFFYWIVPFADEGRYTLRVQGANVGSTGGHIAIDMAAVHEGYWHNECGIQTEPYWNLNDSVRITATAGTPGPTQTLNSGFLTQLASSQTAAAVATGTQAAISAATSTHVAGSTATRASVQSTQGWQTATRIAQGVQTLIASGNGTQAARTQTAVANGLTATAQYRATATEFVSNWRGTLTAAAGATATRQGVVQTQNAAILGTQASAQITLHAQQTATHIFEETQVVIPPIVYQLTLQAAQLATNSAILTQQAGSMGTRIAQATGTATPDTTTQAQLTQLAQVQSTLQALATLQATQQAQIQLTVVVPGQTETDFSTLFEWFTWNEYNTQQVTTLWDLALEREPFATMQATLLAMAQMMGMFANVDWNSAASCDGDMLEYLPQAGEILNGHFVLPDGSGLLDDVTTECTLPFEPFLGPQIFDWVCWGYNFLCAIGWLQLVRWIINLAIVVGFVVYVHEVWLSRASA